MWVESLNAKYPHIFEYSIVTYGIAILNELPVDHPVAVVGVIHIDLIYLVEYA